MTGSTKCELETIGIVVVDLKVAAIFPSIKNQ